MTMTNEKVALLEMIEQGADCDLVREMLAFAAERLMDLEVEARTGASSGEPQSDAAHTSRRLPGAPLGHARGAD